MKNIIKIGLFLFLILAMTNCKKKQLKFEKTFYLENKTEKEIVHQISTNKRFTCGLDTLSFYSNGVSKKNDFEWTITAIFKSQRNVISYILQTNIYNISDTTSLGWAFVWGNDGIYSRFGEEKNRRLADDDDYSISARDYYLTVDDELLSLMKKDYSMLGKFKGYY